MFPALGTRRWMIVFALAAALAFDLRLEAGDPLILGLLLGRAPPDSFSRLIADLVLVGVGRSGRSSRSVSCRSDEVVYMA